MPGTDDPWGNGGQASGGAPDLATEARRARLARDDRPEAGVWPAPSDGRTVAMEDVRGDDPHELADLRAAASPLWGIDVHPVYQRGLNIEALPGAGIGFLAVKVQQGRDTSYLQSGSADWVRRAKAIGLPVIAYIYLMPGDEDGQAAVFAEVLKSLDIAGMVDAEALKGTSLAAVDGHTPDLGGLGQHPHPRGVVRTSQVRVAGAVPAPALTMDGIRRFHARCDYHGADLRLDYIPRWFWERMGSPILAGLQPLWASSYPSRAVGTPQDLYRAVTPDRWAGYGGNSVDILQFAETGLVAGQQPVDVDAYLGTRDELATLLGIPTVNPLSGTRSRRREDADMELPATDTRIDKQVPTDVVGGWCGAANLLLTANTGGATVYGVYAVSDRGPTQPLVTPLLKADAGQDFAGWWPMKAALPAGTTSVVVNYTAPAGMVARIEYER